MAVEDMQERPSLSRERILHAAVEVMDAEGIEAVTMRRIGRELGVEAMSLYNHVEDKASILDGICEVVMAEFVFPPETDDWEELARAGARAWRNLLRSHPNVIALFAERKHPMTSVAALRPMEFALDVFKRTGLSDDEVVRTFRVFGGYIMGFVLMEQGKMMSGVGDAQTPAPADVAALLDSNEVPSFVSLLPQLVNCNTDENFDFGLELLIAGIRSRIAARSS
ncbi:MAG: TetR/AcrR family transcriptional regulator [Actinomycetota bacterium]